MHKIIQVGKNEVLDYAVSELVKYLKAITGEEEFEVVHEEHYKQEVKGIQVALIQQANHPLEVEDAELDDAIEIDIKQGKGDILGSNYRSILIGVYKFFEELGCRWIRPCQDGEILVHKKIEEMTVYKAEKASFRHRGIVIEGANSYENVCDLIEWMPKMGYNSYFIQFMNAYTFFEKWYKHIENPLKDPEDFDIDRANQFTEGVQNEVKKRGMLLHTVGHGWTCECIDILGKGWEQEEEVGEEKKELLALIDGKRELYRGGPINTNLCYSSDRVQNIFVEKVVSYIKENPKADYVHIWLADAFNNHCECEKCKTLIPTDWYVQILNRLDDELTAIGNPTKLVFLLYVELIWPPIREKLNNPERFELMFAPISRTFNKSYQEIKEETTEIESFELNRIRLPREVEAYVAYLRAWQEVFKGDSFDFDYHLGRAHYGDVGYYKISEIISKDIKCLDTLGLNGLLSCQEQRAFFPTALPNYVMGKTLWNKEVEFGDLVEEYYQVAFGEGYKQCIEYCRELSKRFDMDYWNTHRGGIKESLSRDLEDVEVILDQMRSYLETRDSGAHIAQELSWKYLKHHVNYAKYFAETIRLNAKGQAEEASKSWRELAKYIRENEDDLQRVLDVFRVLRLGKVFEQVE